uniref:Elongation of fatty acids protein n=1 Tax=Trypanosoma vivax (strain Y486) TaxID=1055687 RepID=G0TYN9_TRYVY|nr:putative long chain fatty acyl elongase [Trypanosoma vivax Y486]
MTLNATYVRSLPHQWNGIAVRDWMIANTDIALYIAGVYLVMVFNGPKLIARLNKRGTHSGNTAARTLTDGSGSLLVRRAMVLWNLSLSIFSILGTSTVTPVLIGNLREKGFHSATCEFNEKEFYTTNVGFWMGLFALSKIPELIDTVFLVLLGKDLPFLHWYHHVTVLLFSWHAYCVGSSVYIWVAAMNYSVHSVMYFYFALAALGYRRIVRPFAPYITVIQILQMVVGCLVTLHALRELCDETGRGCGVPLSNMRAQLLMYASYLYLFSKMFVKSYLLPPNAHAAVSTASNPTKKQI